MKKTVITKPKVLVILGPTATGKSDLAVELARKLAQTEWGGFNGAEIISADSRQVYKGMDLGTGKITKKEMRGVPHYMLDIVSPKKQFTVADFKRLAQKIITDILRRGKLPIICGGTGFYIDALVYDQVLPAVPPNLKLRKILEKQTAETLFKQLQKLDPARAKNIDKYNKVRLVRAIEIAKAIGKTPPLGTLKSNFEVLSIGLDLPDEILKERISIRLKKRMDKGMIKEVNRLHAQGVSWRKLEKFGLEYKNCAKLLQHSSTMTQMSNNLEKEIWQYVKRQRTWFKRNLKTIWINPIKKSDLIKASKLVKNFILC